MLSDDEDNVGCVSYDLYAPASLEDLEDIVNSTMFRYNSLKINGYLAGSYVKSKAELELEYDKDGTDEEFYNSETGGERDIFSRVGNKGS